MISNRNLYMYNGLLEKNHLPPVVCKAHILRKSSKNIEETPKIKYETMVMKKIPWN